MNEKCHEVNCNAKKCIFPHPKNGINILVGNKCKFGDSCSFEHEIEGFAKNETTKERIDNLEKVIEEKNTEIKRLRNILKKSQLLQLDGVFSADNYSDTTTANESDVSEDEIKNISNEAFQCEHCDFETEFKNGLKIHIARMHKVKCDECELEFKNKECLKRHKEIKTTISNIEPHLSPDGSMKLDILKHDEVCLVVTDQQSKKLLFLHCWSCWIRATHSCLELPPEGFDKEARPQHTDIGKVVMGDLSEPGCFMDWDMVKTLLE